MKHAPHLSKQATSRWNDLHLHQCLRCCFLRLALFSMWGRCSATSFSLKPAAFDRSRSVERPSSSAATRAWRADSLRSIWVTEDLTT